jgi:hypothetical protein
LFFFDIINMMKAIELISITIHIRIQDFLVRATIGILVMTKDARIDGALI